MNRHQNFLRWPRRLLTVLAVTALLMIVALPAFAISFGEPDGNDHPNVGSMVAYIPGEGYFQWCSGTLISENVFLTAGHCTAPVDSFLASVPGAELLVTFDSTIHAGGTFYTGTSYTHPDFASGGLNDWFDVGVIVLDESPGIEPASLPTLGLLDQLKDSKVLKHTRFTAVGYGTIRETNTTGPHGILDNVDRNRTEQGFNALTKSWLYLPMNLTTGNGGTCYGDSGGPHFIHMNGVETDVIVSLTSLGDIPCVASDKTYRIDTVSARSFLGQFVTLP